MIPLRADVIKVECPQCGAPAGSQCIGTKALFGEPEESPKRLLHNDRIAASEDAYAAVQR